MCVVTFIFEKNSRGSNQFLTRYYMAADIGGQTVKYSDLLNVVELNLGYYDGTNKENVNLNILCEFLKIQENKQLQKFHAAHGSGGFGEVLYDKYIKIILDSDRIERVASMGLYQDKYQARYLSENEVKFFSEKGLEKGKEERTGEVAVNAIKKGLSFELIEELTGLNIEKLKELKEQFDKNNIT